MLASSSSSAANQQQQQQLHSQQQQQQLQLQLQPQPQQQHPLHHHHNNNNNVLNYSQCNNLGMSGINSMLQASVKPSKHGPGPREVLTSLGLLCLGEFLWVAVLNFLTHSSRCPLNAYMSLAILSLPHSIRNSPHFLQYGEVNSANALQIYPTLATLRS